MDHNGRNHRSNASTGNKNYHINHSVAALTKAILYLEHKPIVLNSLADHKKLSLEWSDIFHSEVGIN